MMRLLTFCVLVNSERLLFRQSNFAFKLLLQEIFPLQTLNKTALNKTIRTTKFTKSAKILYRQFILKQPNSFQEKQIYWFVQDYCCTIITRVFHYYLTYLPKKFLANPHALPHEHPHAPQIFFKSEQKNNSN